MLLEVLRLSRRHVWFSSKRGFISCTNEDTFTKQRKNPSRDSAEEEGSEKPTQANLSDDELFRKVLHAALDNNKAAVNQALKAIDYDFEMFLMTVWENWCTEFLETADDKVKMRDQSKLKQFHENALCNETFDIPCKKKLT